jgi:hypothetical protein
MGFSLSARTLLSLEAMWCPRIRAAGFEPSPAAPGEPREPMLKEQAVFALRADRGSLILLLEAVGIQTGVTFSVAGAEV